MVEIDFLPERIKDQRRRQRRMIRHGWLLVATIGVLSVLGTIRQGWVRQARAEAFLMAGQRTNRQVMRDRRGPLESERAALQRNKQICDRLAAAPKPKDVLASVEAVARAADKNQCMVLREAKIETVAPGRAATPAGPALAGRPGVLPVSPGMPPAPAPVPTRVDVTLVGIAADDVTVANFIAQLSANRLFEDVNMEYTKTVAFGGVDAREFKVTCHVGR